MVWFVISLILGAVIGYIGLYLMYFMRRSSEEADERRKKYFQKFQTLQIPENIIYQKEWTPNSRGMLLFRQQYIPKGHLRGVIGMCHGFGDHSQEFLTDLAIQFCQSGYAVLSMDNEGHGLSDGLHGHIESMKHLVEDYADYFNQQMKKEVFQNKPFFLFGESMGGAIVFNLCTNSSLNQTIRGAILVAPMVGIADEMKLPLPIINFFRLLSRIIPLAPITPVPDIIDKCFKDPKTLQRAKKDFLGYQKKPRLHSALIMLETTEDLPKHFKQFQTSLLILHGDNDVVTCSEISQKFHDTCQSTDKKLIIYPKGCHGLLRGEYPHTIEEIYNDVHKWLSDRSK